MIRLKRQPRFLSRAAARVREERYAPAASLAAPGFTASMTVPSVSGIMVTPQTALTFSAFYAGIRVISEDMAGLPVRVMQEHKSGRKEVVRSHPVNALFNDTADGECPSFNWREAYISHILAWGTGYSYIDWGDGGYPRALLLIHPSLVVPKREQATGRLYFELQTADTVNAPRGNRILPPYQVFNTSLLGFNGLVGYSVVALQRELIGMGKAMEQFGSSFFGNGAFPAGIIKFARQMRPEALKNFRESWNLIHQGSAAAHKVAVLEEGSDWTQTGTDPEAAQLIEARKFQVIEVCRVLRLPPHKLADFSESHLANVEAANEDYINTTLRGWACRLDASATFKLLLAEERAQGLYVKHDFLPMMLRTAKDEADFYTKMFNIGYYDVDEIRALRGDNPIGAEKGGGKRFIQSNLVDLSHPEAGHPKSANPQQEPDGEPGRPEGSKNRMSPYLNGSAS